MYSERWSNGCKVVRCFETPYRYTYAYKNFHLVSQNTLSALNSSNHSSCLLSYNTNGTGTIPFIACQDTITLLFRTLTLYFMHQNCMQPVRGTLTNIFYSCNDMIFDWTCPLAWKLFSKHS